MRKTLFAFTALASLIGAGAVASAHTLPAPGLVQTVQYYQGGYDRRAEWRQREWRRAEWQRHHRWQEHRRHEEGRAW